MYINKDAPISKFFSPTGRWQDTFLSTLSFLLLAAQLIITGLYQKRLPANIPVHYDVRLNPDRYGDKSEMEILVYIATALFILLSALMQTKFIFRNFKSREHFGEWNEKQGINTIRTFVKLRFAITLIFLGITVLTIIKA